jgi:hypothetical protein
MWLEARDEGTDDADGKHSEIHQVGEFVLTADDPDGKVHPDEDECCRERNAGSSSVRSVATHPHG